VSPYRYAGEDEDELKAQDRLHQCQRPEMQGAELTGEAKDHARYARKPHRAADQPENRRGAEPLRLDAPRTEPLAH
jgi:hypothetical protein